MTAPAAAVTLCKCGHGRPRHDGELAPQCASPSCTCLQYRPEGPAGDTHRVVPIQGDAGSRAALPRCTGCSHGKKRHEVPGFAPACVVADCGCQRYTDSAAPQTSKQAAQLASPPVAPPPEAIRALAGPERPAAGETPTFTEPAAEAAPDPVGVDELLQRGRDSDLKPIVKLAERIDALVDDLRERLADEAAAAGVKNLIAELEQKLAAAKGQLREVATGRRAPSTTTPADGDHACPDCTKTFSSAQGVTMHRTRAHGYRKAGAVA